MITFPSLVAAGAGAAFMSGTAEGDCGWGDSDRSNRRALLQASALDPERLVAARQCHGDSILTVEERDAGCGAADRDDALGEADGLITNRRGVPLGVHVADCVPVLFAGPGTVGAVHAGREGTYRNIAGKAVAAMGAAFGTLPSALHAVIGPSAGPCCYEVSTAIHAEWVQNGMVVLGGNLDLWETNRQQLCAAGMHEDHIIVVRHCTICQPGYFSYRGHRTTHRNLAVVQG